MIHDNLTPAEIAEMIARYRYNAKHDTDRIRALESEVARLYSEIEKMKAVDWRPIETAPRNGTLIVVAYRDGFTGTMEVANTCWDYEKNKWKDFVSNEYAKDIVTHWLPLPKPPTYERK